MDFDPRLTPARDDLAAEKLRGIVDVPRYANGTPALARAGRVPLRSRPDSASPFDTVLLYGEPFDVYDTIGGWAWGQCGLDGYVGYVSAAALGPAPADPATHAVAALACQLYAEPRLKQSPAGILPFGARVRSSSAGVSKRMISQ